MSSSGNWRRRLAGVGSVALLGCGEQPPAVGDVHDGTTGYAARVRVAVPARLGTGSALVSAIRGDSAPEAPLVVGVEVMVETPNASSAPSAEVYRAIGAGVVSLFQASTTPEAALKRLVADREGLQQDLALNIRDRRFRARQVTAMFATRGQWVRLAPSDCGHGQRWRVLPESQPYYVCAPVVVRPAADE